MSEVHGDCAAVILVKRKYGLTWDTAERDTARTVLASCTSTAMLFTAGPAAAAARRQRARALRRQRADYVCRSQGPRHRAGA